MVTLRQRDLARGLVATRRPDKMREVLSVEEAARLLEAAPGIKYKAALGMAYGAGLRVSEVAHLKVDDIDSTRMLIRVEQDSEEPVDTRPSCPCCGGPMIIIEAFERERPHRRFSGGGGAWSIKINGDSAM